MNKTKELLIWAKNNTRAICAFNFSTIDVAKVILEKAKELNQPVILETSHREAEFLSPKEAGAFIEIFRPKYNFVLHLDHGKTESIIHECIAAGYDSVHIDLNAETFEKTVEKIRLLTLFCHAKGVSVEAGFDTISGSSSLEKKSTFQTTLTDPEKAFYFVTRTGADFFVVSIGESHGITSSEKLDFTLLMEIHRRISLPLVLHGGSGISSEDLKTAINLGVCKINFNTELRIAWAKGIKEAFKENPSEIVPYRILSRAHKLIQDVVSEKIKICMTSLL